MFNINDYKFLEQIKEEFGKFESKKEEGLDRAFFIFNKNITQEQWSELINKYKNHWSKRGYKCDIDNDMLKINISPSLNALSLTKKYNSPVFLNWKKMLIIIVSTLILMIITSIPIIYLQKEQLKSYDPFWKYYKYFVGYYIILWFIISIFTLLCFITEHLRKTLFDILRSSLVFDITTYLILLFFTNSYKKDLVLIEYFYLSIDVFLLALFSSIIFSNIIFWIRKNVLSEKNHDSLKEYNQLKVQITTNDDNSRKTINYIDENKLNVNDIILPKSGINDIFDILNVKLFKLNPEKIDEVIMIPVMSVLIFLLLYQAYILFYHLSLLQVVLFFILLIVNILIKTFNSIINDKKNLIYAMYHLKKSQNKKGL